LGPLGKKKRAETGRKTTEKMLGMEASVYPKKRAPGLFNASGAETRSPSQATKGENTGKPSREPR